MPRSWLLALWCLSLAPQNAATRRSRARNEQQEALSLSGYLIASFPSTRMVTYARLPDTTWLALVPTEGITMPEALSVDPERMRLFVADRAAGLVYWYQLEILEDKRLITTGQQHLAAHSIAAYSIAVNSVGTLYISGQRQGQGPALYGVFMQEAKEFEKEQIPSPPLAIWTQENTNLTGQGRQLVVPGGIAVDPFHVYWGNTVREQKGPSVVQATNMPAAPRAMKASLMTLADNLDSVRGLALTPRGILYATGNGVYGTLLANAGKGCGEHQERCPLVAPLADPTNLVWDSDGTVLIACRGDSSIVSIPAGTVERHKPVKVMDAPNIFGITMLPEREQGGEEESGGGIIESIFR